MLILRLAAEEVPDDDEECPCPDLMLALMRDYDGLRADIEALKACLAGHRQTFADYKKAFQEQDKRISELERKPFSYPVYVPLPDNSGWNPYQPIYSTCSTKVP
jgi:hypothetical protein